MAKLYDHRRSLTSNFYSYPTRSSSSQLPERRARTNNFFDISWAKVQFWHKVCIFGPCQDTFFKSGKYPGFDGDFTCHGVSQRQHFSWLPVKKLAFYPMLTAFFLEGFHDQIRLSSPSDKCIEHNWGPYTHYLNHLYSYCEVDVYICKDEELHWALSLLASMINLHGLKNHFWLANILKICLWTFVIFDIRL